MDWDIVDQAVELLKRGGVVAIPTETVYGLAADATNPEAVRRIFEIKGRPANHPLIVHLSSFSQVGDWASQVPELAERLAAAFWPGPLTMILPRAAHVLAEVTGGEQTVGLRVPRHPITAEILRRFGGGLAAPSANRFTRVSPTTAAHVRKELGERVDLIVDGGPALVGIESTIVDLTQQPPVVLRFGGVTLEELESVGHVRFSVINRQQTASPGQHQLHYSPQVKTIVVPTDQLLDKAIDLAGQGERVVVMSQWSPDGALVSGDGALVSGDGVLVSREGALVSREGALVSREGALVSREGALSKDDRTVVGTRGSSLELSSSEVGETKSIRVGAVSFEWWQLPGNLADVARVLYAWLHRVDSGEFDCLLVDLPLESGLGAAISDRLQRAANK